MNTVLESIKNCVKDVNPWPHYNVSNVFDEQIHNWIRNFPYPDNNEINEAEPDSIMLERSNKNVNPLLEHIKRTKEKIATNEKLWYKKVHSCEINFGNEIRQKYKEAQTITDYLTDIEIAKTLEEIGNVSLQNTLVRIQLLKDMPGVQIPLHTDVSTKAFTLLIYFKTENHGGLELGTQLYNGTTFVKRTPYKENSGTFFFPVQKRSKDKKPTLHAFVDTFFEKPRISMIVNFFDKSELGLDVPGNKLGHYMSFKS
jgi:hypothetical protein